MSEGLSLPVRPPRPETGTRPAVGSRIVIAEDDATTRLILSAVLTNGGYQVTEASNGREALERAQEQDTALVILDVMMPEIDGYEVCATLRATAGTSSLPILILTSREDDAAVTRAFEVGATDFATKPISPTLLCHRVRFLLRNQEVVERLRESEAGLANAQRIASLGSWEWHLLANTLRCSRQALALLRLSPRDEGLRFDDYLGRIAAGDLPGVRAAVEAARSGGSPLDLQHRIVLPDGAIRYLHARGELERDSAGRPSLLRGTLQDITTRVEAEQKIRYLAMFDQLTGLPNRIQFADYLGRMLATSKRQNRQAAVLLLDLDHFKHINDSRGHGVGDAVLAAVSARLRGVVRHNDLVGRMAGGEDAMLARLGGDEFMLGLSGLDRGENAAIVARRLIEALRPPVQVGESEIYLGVSVGISVFPQDGREAEELLKHADAALYQAKNAGRNTFEFFDRSLSEAAVERLALENSVRRAVEREEFTLYYQPLVVAATGRLAGAEALLRWFLPDGQLVPTPQVIKVMEETGLMPAVIEWTLRTACRQVRAWDASGLVLPQLSVNLCAQLLRRPDVVDRFEQMVRDAGLGPDRVTVEITEGFLIEQPDAEWILNEFRARGFRVALDDFGTGYSSLSYLRRFPIDTLKLDRSFIRDVPENAQDAAIVRTIVALAGILGIKTVIEGVEQAGQRDFLVDTGCTEMQGYFFGRPMPADELARLLAAESKPAPG